MNKKIFFLALGIFSLSFSFSLLALPAKIEKVTLFKNQALIERKAVTGVDKGINKIEIELEAFFVDKNSISAEIFGDGQIFSVQHRQVHLQEEPQTEIQKLIAKIKEVENKKNLLAGQIKVIQNKEKFLNSLINFSNVQIPREIVTSFPSPQELEKTLIFLDSNLNILNQEKQNIDIQNKDLSNQLDLLKRKLNSLRSQSQKKKNVIEVIFDSTKKQNIEVVARYLVSQAGWSPSYKADIPFEMDKINLTMFSQIKQKSGEDWKNIDLTISNVAPLRGMSLPEPQAWFLRTRVKERMHSKRLLSSHSEQMVFEDTAGFAQPEAVRTPLSFEYLLGQKLTIKSKDKETLLPVFTQNPQGNFYYWSLPRINQFVYLIAEIEPDSQLLEGPLNVAFGGRFIGKTNITSALAGQKLLLNLGVAPDLKIKREKILDKKDETFFGRIERANVIRKLSFKITAENLKDQTAQIRILDAIPVAKTDRIEVKDVRISPEPNQTNYRDKEGLCFWKLSLSPKEIKEILIDFTVVYPKDEPLVGL